MEIVRERIESNESTDQDRRSNIEDVSSSIEKPSAPDFHSLTDVVEDNDWRIPSVQRETSLSIWARARTFFSRYRVMNEENESTVINNQMNDQPNNNQVYNQPNNNQFCTENDPIFGNIKNRSRFLRSIYLLFVGQLSWLSCLAAIFYYVPHIRQIFRKTFADKIFLKSLLGLPVGLVLIAFIMFQPLRRKYGIISYLALTGCLSSLLCYIMAFQSDNLLVLIELIASDGVFASAGLLNLIFPKFTRQRKKVEALYFPVGMIALQGLQPLLIKKPFSLTWYKNLIGVSCVSYLGYNLNSVVNNEKMALKPNEGPFAITQSFINFNPSEIVGQMFSRRRPTAFQRI